LSVLPEIILRRADMGKQVTLTFYSDPGHAWLKVPREKLHALGIAGQISCCSYARNKHVYLEEDLDAGIFLKAAEAAGLKVIIRESNSPERLSRIRTYSCYRPV
jgi:hypothetical protein